MKGQQFAVLCMFWLICVTIIASLWIGADAGFRLLGAGRAYEMPVKIEVYSMQNALDASKVYMDTALRYSVYQACYDSLANAGWPDITDVPADDRVLVDGRVLVPIRTSGEFRDTLVDKIGSNLNVYASDDYSFFEDYEVSLPRYSSVELVEFERSRLVVKAASDGMLQICKPSSCKLDDQGEDNDDEEGSEDNEGSSGFESMDADMELGKQPNLRELVKLQKGSDLQDEIETPCIGLYSDGVARAKELSELMQRELRAELIGSDNMLVDGRNGLLNGVVVASADECNTLVDQAEERIRQKLAAEENVEVHEVTLNVAYAGFNNINNMCLFDVFSVMTPSKAVVIVTMGGDVDGTGGQDEQANALTFPVDNGQEVAFEPLSLSFIVKETFDPYQPSF